MESAEPAAGEGMADPQSPGAEGGGSTAPGASQPEGPSKKKKRPRAKWLPLESNPEVLNGFLKRVGVCPGPEYVDVLGLSEELLQMVPRPVLAVCLLFPSEKIRKPRQRELQDQAGGLNKSAPACAFYLTQHRQFGNACGTIAAMHAVGNLHREGRLALVPGGAVEGFLQRCDGRTPDQIGWDLADATELHEASEAAARSRRSQTETPDREDDSIDGHFVVFARVQGRLVEFDGCMGFPVDHGATSESALLSDTARVIREQFMDRDPKSPNFSVMALAGGSGSPSASAGSGAAAVDEGAVRTLADMGFPEDAVRNALEATRGDADAAVALLCG